MKLISELLRFEGRELTITAMDFRKQPGEVLAQAQLGTKFTITKNGKPIAVLTRIEPDAFELGSAIRKLGLAEPMVRVDSTPQRAPTSTGRAK